MKRITMVLLVFTVLTAAVEMTRAEDTLESQLATRLGQTASLSSKLMKPNEVVEGKVTYSGIAVSWFKTDNLLQLLNPLAPARYGAGDDNILRDPGSGRVYGWKLFSIRF